MLDLLSNKSIIHYSIRAIVCTLFFVVFCLPVKAQNYEQVAATIQLYPKSFDNPEQLSKFISRDFISEEDKVRAIYTWIVNNVAYEPSEYKKFNYNFKNFRERNEKEEATRNKIIERTLQKGIAVCEGYAMLFERLCELQGIENYLVRGDTKASFKDIGRPFKKNHMWNIATIDGKQYIFDPTWGAGKYNGKFIKDPTYFYYKTPPKLFFKTHYPAMYEDALIDAVISKEVFANMPIIIPETLRREDVEKPLTGIISSEDDDGFIDFQIRNSNPSNISYSFGKEPIAISEIKKEANLITFKIPLQLGASTLLIYFDDQPALAYKID